MEAKLKEYRARRRRQELIEKTTEKLGNTKRQFVDLCKKMIKINVDDEVGLAPAFTQAPQQDVAVKKKHLANENDYDERYNVEVEGAAEEKLIETASDSSEVELKVKAPETWRYFIVKCSILSVIWITLYYYFLSLQFGAVFFAISLLIGIYFNTRTQPKKRGEVSAYSVFNENCESIEGTLTPEKLQNEMFFGSFRLF